MIKFKQVLWTVGLAALTSLAACGGDDTPADDDGDDTTVTPDANEPDIDAPPGHQEIRVNEDITANTTWTANNTYILPRLKYVFVQPGATLTIEPGTRIEGEQGSVLVVTRGAKIEAVGTAESPIVMTSRTPNKPGFWGGLLVLGAAPINNNTLSTPTSNEATFEAFTSSIPEGKFGGDNAADDSGTLKYVRIEFAGFNFVADREFNNLTLCGVGSATEIDYVQVHGGTDDGVEFFGGTANIKHVVSSQNGDDGFDTDNGWVGNAQFIVIQNLNPQGSTEASNGYESDNHAPVTGDGGASFNATPRTSPTVSNVTILGKRDYSGGKSFATIFRRGTAGKYYNHIVMDFPLGVEFRDSATKAQLDAGAVFFAQSLFYNNAADGTSLPPPEAANDIVEGDYLFPADTSPFYHANHNNIDPGLTAERTSLTAPNFKPADGALALTSCGTPPEGAFFDAAATFCGAVGAADWTLGWTAYPQPE
jgi:hypothetical protein